MDGNNAYFEHAKKFFAGLTEDELAEQIGRFQTIVKHLEEDSVWQLLLQDIDRRCSVIDSTWQEAKESQLDQMRILKKAFMYVRDLPERYKQDLDFMKEEMEIKNSKDEIEKDYDTEGIE